MELKDVLHYYMGREYSFPGGNGEVNALTLVAIKFAMGNGLKVKLHLRKLEDMTEEERDEIWQMLVGRPFPKTGSVLWFDSTRTLAKRCVMMSGVDRVGIEMTGHVWWDCDLHHQLYNPHRITHYLLAKGFDLFSLIDSGAALDAKTFKPSNNEYSRAE